MGRFHGWHLAGALAAGGLVGWIAGVHASRDALSVWELNELEPSVRSSLAFSGRQYVGPYECSDDCSGHLAGYTWAREHHARLQSECEGHNTNSFLEGCRYYLQVAGEMRDER